MGSHVIRSTKLVLSLDPA